MNKLDVSAFEIRDYAISYGWTLVKAALVDGLFVLNSPNGNYTQLIFPKDDTSIEYQEMGKIAITRLSEFYKKSFSHIVEEIREVNDDVICIRYFSNDKMVNSLSFQSALETIEATKQMLLAACSSAVHPVLYHKRLARIEAIELLKQTRFRHTQEGSFILKVSCPIVLIESPNKNIFGDIDGIKPINRKAFEIINEGAYKLLTSIEEGNDDQLFIEQQNAEKPIISYNFCDSLVNLFDNERELPFELSFNWSRHYLNKLPSSTMLPTKIKFPYSFKAQLEQLKNYFKPVGSETIDTFFGTVESLNGDEVAEGGRAGEVFLALIIESEIVKARINLDVDKYHIAYKAHGQVGALVKVKGRLYPGKRIRNLEEISLFELVSKENH